MLDAQIVGGGGNPTCFSEVKLHFKLDCRLKFQLVFISMSLNQQQPAAIAFKADVGNMHFAATGQKMNNNLLWCCNSSGLKGNPTPTHVYTLKKN